MTTIQEIVDFMRDEVEDSAKRMPNRKGKLDVADFRYAIFISQCGDLARYISHETRINPGARAHGSPAEEESAYGHALLQLLATAVARDVNVVAGVEKALQALRERDWAHRGGREDGKVQGLVGSWHQNGHGDFVEATLVRYVPGGVITGGTGHVENLAVLFSHATSEATPTMLSPMTTVVVAEQGGTMCHAAIVCREWAKNCVVGTGPIPWPDGTRVRIWNDGRIEKVIE